MEKRQQPKKKQQIKRKKQFELILLEESKRKGANILVNSSPVSSSRCLSLTQQHTNEFHDHPIHESAHVLHNH